MAVKDDLGATIAPLLMLALAIGGYLLRPPNESLVPGGSVRPAQLSYRSSYRVERSEINTGMPSTSG